MEIILKVILLLIERLFYFIILLILVKFTDIFYNISVYDIKKMDNKWEL